MTDGPSRGPRRRTVLRATAHVAVGENGRIGSAIYGTIVVMAALLLGALGVIDELTSISLAIAVGLTTLAVQGYRAPASSWRSSSGSD